MKRFALLLCCCGFLLNSCDKEEKDGLGSIYGMVIEETTGQPISGVRITLEKRSREDHSGKYYWGIIGSTVSFADGHFEFIDLHTHISYLAWRDVGSGSKTYSEKARYQVILEIPRGYDPTGTDLYTDRREITVEKDRVSRIDFRLRKSR